MKEQCVENMPNQKIISFILGILLYIILCLFITDYTIRLTIGLVLLILYLGFIFILKDKNDIQ